MLPEALSNGACSLNAGEDKLALSALMTLDTAGSCRSLRLVKSVIHSRVRGVYDEVNALFADTADEAVPGQIRARLAPAPGHVPSGRPFEAGRRETGHDGSHQRGNPVCSG